MKINNKPLPGPSVDYVVLPRPKTEEPDPQNPDRMVEVNNDIVFRCQAVLDFSRFESLVPEPKPPQSLRPGQTTPTPDFNHPDFVKSNFEWALKKQNWLTLQSLMATPNLEWEKVNLDDPDTWHLWDKELQEGGITLGEILRIQQKIHEVNGLDEDKFEQARKTFLAGNRGRAGK